MIWDITISLQKGMPAFPGDEEVFQWNHLLKVENGDPYSIKKIEMLTHAGTHIDVPSHFIPNGKNLESIDISKLIGIADVFQIKNTEKITLDEIKDYHIEPNSIVLFKTVNSNLWKSTNKFYKKYVYLTPEAAQFLVEKKIKCVGIDYLSIESFEETSTISTHVILLSNDVIIIEGLDLSEIKPGRYRLICLPLKMVGVDGSPVRAILEELDD